MVNYQNGKIYRIICNVTNEFYIGSTTQALSKRLAEHVDQYKLWQKGIVRFVTSFNILKNGDYSIILIENFPCETKELLLMRERYWMEQMPNCINLIKRPIVNDQEKKEKKEKYKEENKNLIREYKKKYREQNKESIQEYNRKYLKKYYEENKEREREQKSEMITCDCGASFQRTCKSRHLKTFKHYQLLNRVYFSELPFDFYE